MGSGTLACPRQPWLGSQHSVHQNQVNLMLCKRTYQTQASVVLLHLSCAGAVVQHAGGSAEQAVHSTRYDTGSADSAAPACDTASRLH